MTSNQLLGLAIALGAAACAADSSAPDELAGDDGSEAGKLDGSETFTYWQVQATAGGYTVSRPNRTATDCGDGSRGPTCTVEALDLAGTAMPASVAKSYADRLRAGEAILLRGDVGVKPYAVLSSIAGSAIADADLVPALPPTSPSIHLGDENGPDCLYARLFVQDVDVETADIRVTETATGTLAVHAHFEGISIPATSEYAMSCVNGTSPFNIVAGELTADGTMSVAADGTVSFANLSYHWNGVYYNSSSPPPSAIEDLLFSDSKALGDIVTSSVAIAMQPLVASTKNGRVLAATEVWLPGAPDVTDPSGVFVLVSQNGDRVSERKVNSTLTANIDEIDLDESGATADAIERANAQLAAGESVLVVGYRYSSGGKKGRSANQFWTKAPVPQQ